MPDTDTNDGDFILSLVRIREQTVRDVRERLVAAQRQLVERRAPDGKYTAEGLRRLGKR